MLILMLNSMNRFKKASLLGGFFVVIFFVLTACTERSSEEKMIFRYNESAGIPSLDPAFAKEKSSIWAVQQLYEGLVFLDDNNEIAPALALDWAVDSTATVYRFRLRQARFHSGNIVTANDVVYSLNRLKDPEVASPGSWVVDGVISCRALDSTSLEIVLKQPNSTFLSLLAMPFCSVVPENERMLATMPVGTGPFRFHV